jgi:hypothetical protein
MTDAPQRYLQYCESEGLRINPAVVKTLKDASVTLDFSSTYLGPRQCAAVVKVVRWLPELQQVKLAGVGLTDDVCTQLISECASLQDLVLLELHSNPMLTDKSIQEGLHFARNCPTIERIVFRPEPTESQSQSQEDGFSDLALHKLEIQLECNRLAKRNGLQGSDGKGMGNMGSGPKLPSCLPVQRYLNLAMAGEEGSDSGDRTAAPTPTSPSPSRSNAHRAVHAAIQASSSPTRSAVGALADLPSSTSVPSVVGTATLDSVFPDDWDCISNGDDLEVIASDPAQGLAPTPLASQDSSLVPVAGKGSGTLLAFGKTSPTNLTHAELEYRQMTVQRYLNEATKDLTQIGPSAVGIQPQTSSHAIVSMQGGHVGLAQVAVASSVQKSPTLEAQDSDDSFLPSRRPTTEVDGSIDVLPRFEPYESRLSDLLRQHRSREIVRTNKDNAPVPPLPPLFTDPEFPSVSQAIFSTSNKTAADHLCRAIRWRRLSTAHSTSTSTASHLGLDPSGGDRLPWYSAGGGGGGLVSSLASQRFFTGLDSSLLKGVSTQLNAVAPALANQWFLNALSLIHLHGAASWVQRCLVRAHAELGLYVVRFFKGATPVEVTVDDYLPCCRVTDRILFAMSSSDGVSPNGAWASIIEKAYSKLHGGYDRLAGGSVGTALQDLTGGYCRQWRWDLHSVASLLKPKTAMKNSQSLNGTGSANSGLDRIAAWIQAQLHAAGQSGGLCSCESVANGIGAKAALTASGLIPNGSYLLLSVHTVSVDPAEQDYTLLKLRSPDPSKVWNGRFGPKSVEWTPQLRRQLFADESTGSTSDFFMTLEDFLGFFNRFLRLTYPSFSQASLASAYQFSRIGYWVEETQGGVLDSPRWTDNPSYYIRAPMKYTTVTIELSQRDERLCFARGRSGHAHSRFDPTGTPAYTRPIVQYSTMQLLVFQLQGEDRLVSNSQRRVLPLHSLMAVASAQAKTLCVDVQVHPERPIYVVVCNDTAPSETVARGKSVFSERSSSEFHIPRGGFRFTLKCISSAPVTLDEAVRTQPIRQTLTGQWEGPTAAGRLGIDGGMGDAAGGAEEQDRKDAMGCRNPQFAISTSVPQTISVALTQDCVAAEEAQRLHRPQLYSIALYVVLNTRSGLTRCRKVDLRTPFERRRTVTLDIDTRSLFGPLLDDEEEEVPKTEEESDSKREGTYKKVRPRSLVVIPATYGENETTAFELTVFSEKPCTVSRVIGAT